MRRGELRSGREKRTSARLSDGVTLLDRQGTTSHLRHRIRSSTIAGRFSCLGASFEGKWAAFSPAPAPTPATAPTPTCYVPLVRPPLRTSPWSKRLRRSIDATRDGAREEDVHRLRIALERLRVWALLGRDAALADELRWLRRKAGAVRDVDVRLALVPEEERRLVAKERPRRARALRRALEAARVEKLLRGLGKAPPPTQLEARARLSDFARRALGVGDEAVVDHGNAARMHPLRRAIRRVRFALEWLGDDASGLAALQRELGLLCDRLLAAEVTPSLALPKRVMAKTLAALAEHYRALRPTLRKLAAAK